MISLDWINTRYPIVYKVLFVYSIFGILLLFFLPFRLNTLFQILIPRIFLFGVPLLLSIYTFGGYIEKHKTLILQLFPLILLSFFYNETILYNSFLDFQFDFFLYDLDENIFGFQPAYEFSKNFNSHIFSELMCFGYISYYFLIFFTPIVLYRVSNKMLEYSVFMIVVSFIFYYAIFSVVPAAGPQFFYKTPLNEFRSSGIFGNLLTLIHRYGEVPAAAFPSSHVGLAVIILILLFKKQKWYFLLFLPLTLMLILSTVYIRAHYAVDVFGGLLSAPIVYYFVDILYVKLNKIRSYGFGNR